MTDGADLLAVETADGGVHLVALVPVRILDELEISGIGEGLRTLIDGGARKLVIDFSAVAHLSSSALGMLITVRQQLDEVHGSIKLCNIRPEILEVFKITSLDKLFSIYPSADEALSAF